MRAGMIPSLLALLAAVNFCSSVYADPVPVVLWHGIDDSCCEKGIGRYATLIENNVPGVYVISVRIGDTEKADHIYSIFDSASKQVETVCKQLSSDPKIVAAGKFNAIGFSQGNQLLRGILQRCTTSPPMHNYISIGGQHQGVFGIPSCPAGSAKPCEWLRKVATIGAYLPLFQKIIMPAQYWHDPFDEDNYKKKSEYLADLNQELTVNPLYKANFVRLNNFVLVKFLRDTVVQPIESEWFGFYVAGQDKVTYNYTQGALYQQDRLGLKTLDQLGKLKFLSVDADHQQFSDEWFINYIIDPYLKE